MKVPVSYVINKAFYYMDAKQNQTFRLILEMISSNKEEIDISVSLLSYMCRNSEMYTFASDLLVEYATRQEIEEFLTENEKMMQIDCKKGLQALKERLYLSLDDNLKI